MKLTPIPRKTAKKIVAAGKFIRFVKKGWWEYVERNNCTGVVIIVGMTEDKKVVFTEQYRVPVGKNVIEFPAGLVNDHGRRGRERVSTAARRELLEETGFKAARILPLLEGPISSGLTSDLITMVRAVGLTKAAKGGGVDWEGITVHEIPLNEVEGWLKTMTAAGRLVDPKVFAGLYFLNQDKITGHSPAEGRGS